MMNNPHFKLFKFLLLILTFVANLAGATPLEESLLKLNSELEVLQKAKKLPESYRQYMDFYAQDSHDQFIDIRSAWINIVKKLPEELSAHEVELLKEVAQYKFIEQVSLEELVYYAFIFDVLPVEDCRKDILPLFKGMNKIFGEESAPFGLSERNSILSAYYFNTSPPQRAFTNSIHSCLKKEDPNFVVSFLLIPGETFQISDSGNKTVVSTDTNLTAGKYQSSIFLKSDPENPYEFEVLNSSLGTNLYVYSLCHAKLHTLEGRCFYNFAKVCTSRRK